MRKTIYISSQSQWDEVKDSAKGMGLSVSQYLLGGRPDQKVEEAGVLESDIGQLDRIEDKIDKLMPVAAYEDTQERFDKLMVEHDTADGPQADVVSASGVIKGLKRNLHGDKPELSVRENYKIKHPKGLCPKCHSRNKDCVCL